MKKNIPVALATLTGGEYERFSTRKGFENNLIDFANHLHNRYELSFEPKSPHPGLHRIGVRLREPRKDVTLLYRTTYWVPGGGDDGKRQPGQD
jgi:hypothetical protein